MLNPSLLLSDKEVIDSIFHESVIDHEALRQWMDLASSESLFQARFYLLIRTYLRQNIMFASYYFEHQGVMLEFLEKHDYEHLAPAWLTRHYRKKDFYIPEKILHLAKNKHLHSIIKKKQVFDLFKANMEEIDEVIIYHYLCRIAQPEEKMLVYKKLPSKFQDEQGIASLVILENRLGYFELSFLAQCHPPLLSHAMSHVTYRSQNPELINPPINIHALDINVILHMAPTELACHLVYDILKQRASWQSHPEIQAKWLSLPYYQYVNRLKP